MTKKFIEKIIKNGRVDTKLYRYKAEPINRADAQYVEIRRVKIDLLDTTAAYAEWETLKVIKFPY